VGITGDVDSPATGKGPLYFRQKVFDEPIGDYSSSFELLSSLPSPAMISWPSNDGLASVVCVLSGAESVDVSSSDMCYESSSLVVCLETS
jgi:hypothetical protein